jgi:hypothetical protein
MQDSPPTSSNVFRTAGRLLTFRLTQKEFLELGGGHLVFGLVCSWLVGMGRYWDDPGAHLLQRLGVGSVIYVFALSLFLWLLIWPLRPQNWSYRNLLTFVSLVSPPAILYAIPVERWFTLRAAITINILFLGVVATWRVALLVFYLRRYACLRPAAVGVAALLPLTVIVVTLTVLNLERAVFEVMAGIGRKPTANDGAYAVLFLLSALSYLAFLPLLIGYVAFVLVAFRKKRTQEKLSVAPRRD